MRILVTGGLGFIGSALIRRLITGNVAADGRPERRLSHGDHEVLNLDRVSYSSTFESVQPAATSDRYRFARIDLTDLDAVTTAVLDFAPQWIFHLAAESHVDRSIDGPLAFVHANVVGTANLLEAARLVPSLEKLIHVSTDEVFGSLAPNDRAFHEATPYRPRSPYSATKAASDHLVRAWGETFDLPIVVTNCSNNYGPYQFPEKLIPLMTIRAARNQLLPVYGRGSNRRDWLHVDDHVTALLLAADRGRPGQTYTIGGDAECSNLHMVGAICDAVDRLLGGEDRRRLISFVADRPGHDLRYAIDASRARDELGWAPTVDLDTGLETTVAWYLEHEAWWAPLLDRDGTGDRLGLATTSAPTLATDGAATDGVAVARGDEQREAERAGADR